MSSDSHECGFAVVVGIDEAVGEVSMKLARTGLGARVIINLTELLS